MSVSEFEKLDEFSMPVQGGMLEALGINLYANLAKCLVEFAANSYDSEASFIDISIPFEDIQTARKNIREQAKSQNGQTDSDPYKMLEATLPEEITVTIRDDGHGMTPKEVQNKFLPLNRNRRNSNSNLPNLKSKNGKRFVMGRKGLGKLAGFGAAEKIIIQTKRSEQNYITRFVLDLEILKKENLGEVKIPANYSDLKDNSEFTVITLTKLKYGATGQRQNTIEKIIDQNFFGISSGDFDIQINGTSITRESPEYELYYPTNDDVTYLQQDEVSLDNSNIKLPFSYRVKFRKRGDSLKASQRGVRVYCNNRLAAGPTLLGLNTGMHNFYAIDYMEMIVQADALDRHGIDLINTNRTELKSDNDLIEAFFIRLQKHMKDAVNAHSAFRDEQTVEELKNDPEAQLIDKIISGLSKKSQTAGRKILKILAVQFGVGSDEFKELSPLVVQSMNASEVLIRLIEAGTKADSINEIAHLLSELSAIEQKDAIKLFKARRNGIIALSQIIQKGKENWNKFQFENELHDLLKENSWLIRPELATHMSSDENLDNVTTRIAQELKIDEFGVNDSQSKNKRPDLVYVLSDTPHPYEIHIVELKSPAKALCYENVLQLERYMHNVENYLKQHYSYHIVIRGILIGTKPKVDTSAEDQSLLLSKLQKNELNNIEVLGLEEMLSRTQRAHNEMILVMEKEELVNQD